MNFKLQTSLKPLGDQPAAIESLVAGLKDGLKDQTLLGVTGSGKTFTMAKVIETMNRPALIMSPNKTLAAQLYSEFRQFFPENAVKYFVSYYDYYQPEAYIPQTDTFIEKDASINEEIERLRHGAVQALLTRRDTLIVASVSAIYGLGDPNAYMDLSITVNKGEKINRQDLLARLIYLQYQRNDTEPQPGTFRVKGDVIEVQPATAEEAIRIELFGDIIEGITRFYHGDEGRRVRKFRTRGERSEKLEKVTLFPAKLYMQEKDAIRRAMDMIRHELAERLKELKTEGKLLEAQRLEQRTNFDLETLEQTGYVSGIENYSRHIDGRKPGEPPKALLDYFPKDFLLFMDESHIGIPQVRGMHAGDRARKQVLVEHGFRLPSAIDNRPLNFDEFRKHVNQAIYVSATPGTFEFEQSKNVAEQLIRPTGLLDPEIEVRPTEEQIDDLVREINSRTQKRQRVLVTTLTKRLSEEIADYLQEQGIKAYYLHSEIDTFERVDILNDLRKGNYDVVVGINLLREGLDLPEVSLVAILDADKEGFLRNETTLIQTMGRAARHVEGKVIMYADKMTGSMRAAMGETERRRKKQAAYNKKHGITPTSIKKDIVGRSISDDVEPEDPAGLEFGRKMP